MRRTTQWVLLFGLSTALACADSHSPTGVTGGGAFDHLEPAGPLATCNTANGFAVQNFTLSYPCGAHVVLTMGTGWAPSETSYVRSGLGEAAGDWSGILGDYGLPDVFTGGTGTTVAVNMSGGSGTYFCGVTPNSATINITREPGPPGVLPTCSNPTDIAHLGSLIAHEFGHALGFGSVWHKIGPDSITGNCVLQLPTAAPVNSINTSPCAHELEALYTAYGVSGRTQPSYLEDIVTGVSGLGSRTLTLGVPDTERLSKVLFDRGNSAWIYGTGCQSLAPKMTSAVMMTAPPGGCQNRLGTVDLTWSSSDTTVFKVAQVDSASAVLTAVAPGTATLILTSPDFGSHYYVGSAFLALGARETASITVATRTPAAIRFTAGTDQTATVHTNVAINPVAHVTAFDGTALAGDTVDFAIAAGRGTVGSASIITNANGDASTTWKMGDTAGIQVLKATVRGTSVTATDTATAIAGLASRLVIASGNNQTAPAGAVLPVDPTVRATDAYGNGVSGVSIQFAPVKLLYGSVSPTSVTTNDGGFADVAWTLGSKPLVDSMTGTSAGLAGSPVWFVATAVSGGGTLQVTACRSSVVGAKTYHYFTLSWSGVGSGTHQIYESSTNSPATAGAVASGSGSSASVELGPYLQTTSTNVRYWWLDDAVAANPNPTNVNACQL